MKKQPHQATAFSEPFGGITKRDPAEASFGGEKEETRSTVEEKAAALSDCFF